VFDLKLILGILTVLIILAISVFAYILYFVVEDLTMQILGTLGIAFIIFLWLFFEFKRPKAKELPVENISCFVLLSPDGEKEKEWHSGSATSFLIGKGTVTSPVDIELGDSQYGELIANEHAVLNFMDGTWYLEDLGSVNGVGLRKKGEEYTLRLKPLTSYKIDEGDTIYISKARILVR